MSNTTAAVRGMQHPSYTLRMPVTKGAYPHGDALARIRKLAGDIGMEKAAGRIKASRSAWDSWERQGKWPSQERLGQIVSEFGVPPAEIGYEPPDGWELVPTEWFRAEVAAIEERARVRHEEVMTALHGLTVEIRARK